MGREFVALHEASWRTAALFATQQRWLVSHVALSCYFTGKQSGHPGLTRRSIGHLSLRYGIASRNTAHAFFEEAMKYGVIQLVDKEGDMRTDQARPSPQTLAFLTQWYAIHFQTLDLIDGGDRAARFLARSDEIITLAQPILTNALLSNTEVRAPRPLYTIFTRADAGGLLMDRLIAGIDLNAAPSSGKYLTDVGTISYLARSFGLSRAHTSRKLAAAEEIGGIGWSGARGRSRIWISREFFEEYTRAQARKLVILDTALMEALAILESYQEQRLEG